MMELGLPRDLIKAGAPCSQVGAVSAQQCLMQIFEGILYVLSWVWELDGVILENIQVKIPKSYKNRTSGQI